MNLTERQRLIITQFAADIPPELHEAFFKYISDVLRPKRTPWDSDVAHASCAALIKYASPH